MHMGIKNAEVCSLHIQIYPGGDFPVFKISGFILYNVTIDMSAALNRLEVHFVLLYLCSYLIPVNVFPRVVASSLVKDV